MTVNSDRILQLRGKALEHLEAAQACCDETQDGQAGYLIEQAMDWIRSTQWPTLDPNLERFRRGTR